eukprot:5743301-Alexandrium_andersonii.AAC.1
MGVPTGVLAVRLRDRMMDPPPGSLFLPHSRGTLLGTPIGTSRTVPFVVIFRVSANNGAERTLWE